MTTATTIITLALNTSGVLGVGQTPQAQDVADSLTTLNNMISQWNAARRVAVIPGVLATFPDIATDVPSWSGNENVLVWNLSVRLRPVFGLAEDEQQTKLAEMSVAVLQANNKQQQPAISAARTDNTANGIVLLALRAAGRVTDTQSVLLTSQDVNDGVLLLLEMLDEWQQDRAVTVTPGVLPSFPNGTTIVAMTNGVRSAIMWNLAVRMRSAFGLDESKFQTEQAARAFAAIQANNKQQQAAPSIAATDNTGYGLVFLALRAAGRITDEQSVTTASQDVSDAASFMQEMLDEWTLERIVTVTPGVLPTIGDLTVALTLPTGYKNAIVLNLATRLREAFGINGDTGQAARAEKALALIQANNKQQVAPLHPGVPATPMQVIFLALRAAGRITDEQSVSDTSADVDNAFSLLVTMLAQWSKQRWLIFDDVDVAAISTGAVGYSIGPACVFNTASRVDRIESAFARQNFTVQNNPPIVITVAPEFNPAEFSDEFAIGSTSTIIVPPTIGVPGPSSIDYSLTVIDSREEYNRIALKGMASFPSVVFLDSATPTGTVYVWPIPSAGQFEIHLAVKASLPTYAIVNEPLNLPPEYTDAIIYNLACRLSVLTGRQPSPSLMGLAHATLQTVRKTNFQIPVLMMPSGMPGMRGRSGLGYGGFASPVSGSGLTDGGGSRLVAG